MKYVPLQILLTAIFAMSLSSCIKDREEIGAPSGELTVKFTVNMPGVTRSLGDNPDEESTIETLDVLAFVENAVGDFVYTYAATDIIQTPGSGTNVIITARVKEYLQRQQFMVLANASDELAAAGPIRGKELTDVADLIICDAGSGEWPAHNNGATLAKAFPMYGKTTPQTITPATGTIGTYPLVRMVSRIDVTIKSTVNNFKLVNASLFNYKKAGYVSYEQSNFNPTATPYPTATLPAVPTAGDHTGDPIVVPTVYFEADNNGAILRSIYTYETPAITSEAGKLTGTALVIGGYYGNNTNDVVFYRVDIKTTDDNSSNVSSGLLRNHHYKVEIQSVSDVGYPSAIEAYKGANPIDFEVQVIPWGDEVTVPLPYAVMRSANSYITSPEAASFNIPIYGQMGRAMVDGHLPNGWIDADMTLGTEVLWAESQQATEIVAKVSVYKDPVDFTKSLLTVTPGNTVGNAVVCVFNDKNGDGVRDAGDDILWSWHIWSCNKSDYPKEYAGGRWMDRDLGALRSGSWATEPQSPAHAQISADPFKGLLYQYGRKDPVPNHGRMAKSGTGVPLGNYYSNPTLEYATNNPATQYPGWTGTTSSWSSLSKTVFDPCPDGWRTPSQAEWAAVSYGTSPDDYTKLSSVGYSPLDRNVSNVARNITLNTNRYTMELSNGSGNGSFAIYTTGGNNSVRCIRDGAGQPGVVTPTLTTDYDGGKTISTDGGTYTITIASNTEWEAVVRRGTDVVTSGSAGALGEPLLDPATGFGGGLSSNYVLGYENGTLDLTTVDYSSSGLDAQGELEIVFRDKATGVILDQITVTVKDPSIAPRFARSNIVWIPDTNYPRGGYLTFAVTVDDNRNRIPANVQGVFFKWGSLVAVSPVGDPFNGDRIVFSAASNYTYTWGGLTGIPYANETIPPFDDGDINADDFATYNGGIGYNGFTDKGDICRYISAQPGWVEGNWRLPTAQEYNDLMGEGSVSNGGPFTMITGGAPAGNTGGKDNAHGFWQSASGYWLGKGAAYATNCVETAPTGSTVYISASGTRLDDGNTGNAGNNGELWSGSSRSSTNASYLYVGRYGAGPGSIGRQNGYPVRCIRDDK